MTTIGAKRLARVLGAWAGGGAPLYRELSDALTGAIERGELTRDLTLPPERGLAAELAVSRTTVMHAYRRLKEAGLLESKQGSGTSVVAGPIGGSGLPDFTGEIYSAVLSGSRGAIDLTSACQAALPGFRRLVAGAIDLGAALTGHGYQPAGLPGLREAVAERFCAAGAVTRPDDVVITTGAQQAIGLVADVLARPGDAVLVEEYTFPGALDAFRSRGLRCVPVAIDGQGVRPDALREALAVERPAFAYVMPSYHNPTGTQLPMTRRKETLDLATSAGVMIVEDNTLELLGAASSPRPPLAAIDGSGLVVSIGSLSKSVWGGLRVGWLRAPGPVADRAVRAKTVSDIGSPILNQQLATHVVMQLDELAAEMLRHLAVSYRALARAFASRLESWSCPRPDGGLCAWVEAPTATDVDALAQLAQRRGLVITPGSLFRADGASVPRLRIPFIYAPHVMEAAVDRLAEANAEMEAYPTE
ncbi:MAG: PLP-dependent aminotransferase family protein [Acidimicrobiia bacterium]